MNRLWILLLGLALIGSCAPQQEIKLVRVENVQVRKAAKGALLTGDAVFFNPNRVGLRLKEVRVDVLVDAKKVANLDQLLSTQVKGKSEFTVPLEVELNLSEFGLSDALQGLFGGRKYQVQYQGYLKVAVNGVPLKIKVDHQEEFKLRF